MAFPQAGLAVPPGQPPAVMAPPYHAAPHSGPQTLVPAPVPPQPPQPPAAHSSPRLAQAPPRVPRKKKKQIDDEVLVTQASDEETEDGRLVNRQVRPWRQLPDRRIMVGMCWNLGSTFPLTLPCPRSS